MLKFLSILLLLGIFIPLSQQVFFDYFEVILDRFEKLSESRDIVSWDLKIRKVNKIRSMVGNISLHEPLDNNFKIEVKCLKKQGGEYRYQPYRLVPTPICDLTNSDQYVWPDILRGSNFPEGCPIPAGEYEMYNVSSELKNVPKGMLQSGEYCAEANTYKGETIISTYRLCAFINSIN